MGRGVRTRAAQTAVRGIAASGTMFPFSLNVRHGRATADPVGGES